MKVAVAMSGGVDSSVAAYLLKEKQHDICGVTFKIKRDGGFIDRIDCTCLSNDDVSLARSITERLGIPHYVLNYGDNFRRDVVDNFIRVYREGGTPNPCIDCNKYVKFGALLRECENLGCDKIATGHYARIEYDESLGRYLLKRAKDQGKDQTYVLYTLSQNQLAKTLLPLGEYSKEEIREIAHLNGFENAGRRDSQDICFIPDGDYAGFIEEYTGKKDEIGDFVDCEGNVLGPHKGIMHYTIGQGKQLGIAIGRKAFVTNIDPETRKITLGDNDALFKSELVAEDVNIIVADRLDVKTRVTVKIRYSAKEVPAYAFQDEAGLLHIEFDEPVRAITKGQSVVMYDGDIVVGGGKIV